MYIIQHIMELIYLYRLAETQAQAVQSTAQDRSKQNPMLPRMGQKYRHLLSAQIDQ